MLAGSRPINLEMLKLVTAAIINRCSKILEKWQLIKKDCDPKELFLKTFFPCSLLCLIARNGFLQNTVFLFLTKVFEAIHSLMDTAFTLEEHLQPWIVYIQCIWQIFLFKVYLSDTVIISGGHLQWSSIFKGTVFLWNKHLQSSLFLKILS